MDGAGKPTSALAWWVNLDRKTFYRKQVEEQARMQREEDSPLATTGMARHRPPLSQRRKDITEY